MDSPIDSTAVIRMQQDFDEFLSASGSRLEHPSFRLNLDLDINSKRNKPICDHTIKKIIEEEKEKKLMEAELLAAKGHIAHLQTQLASSHTTSKRARIEIEKKLDAIKYEKEHEVERTSELRAKLRQMAESVQTAKAELVEGRREWEAARISLESKLNKVQREKLQLEEDLQKSREEAWQLTMSLKEKADDYLGQFKLCATELEETKAQYELQKKRVEDMAVQLAELDEVKQKLKMANEKIMVLEEQASLHAEDIVVTRAMRARIEKVPGLEKEVAKLSKENEFLRQQKQNALLLQEKLFSTQQKLEAAEKRCEDMLALKIENEDLHHRLLRWEVEDAGGSRRPQSPSELVRRVTELQTAQVLSLEKQGQLQSNLSVAELKLKETKEQHQKMQAELAALQIEFKKEQDLVKRLRRKLLLITKEREGYKRILDSYESEVTVTLPSNSRVQQLEEVVEGYRQHVQELETQLQQVNEQHNTAALHCLQLEQLCQGQKTSSSTSLKVDQDKIRELQEHIIQLELENKKILEQKEILEMRIEQRHLQGDYDPTQTKVFHFTMNPSDQAQSKRKTELIKLQEENARLSARVQLLEESGGKVEDLTIQVEQKLESIPESKMIEEMKAQLAREELRKNRLVEAFRKTSQEFRETCYQLLGYKIDMPCTGQYRLASMYAESQHDYLLFKQGSSGEIQMLQTDFSARQQDNIALYLHNKDSIPALLSAITLELFNQQTMNLG